MVDIMRLAKLVFLSERSMFCLLVAVSVALTRADGGTAAAQREAEEAQEAAAQKALTDALTDALAMMRHGSARAKEQAAHQIAQLAIETTVSQPFHPVTCVLSVNPPFVDATYDLAFSHASITSPSNIAQLPQRVCARWPPQRAGRPARD